MKALLLSSVAVMGLCACNTNHVNSWDRQSSALDPVGMTSRKLEAKNKAEQAMYKPGQEVTFKNERLMVFEQDPESHFSTGGQVKNTSGSAKVLVCGDMFAKVQFDDGKTGFVSINDIVNPQEIILPTGLDGLTDVTLLPPSAAGAEDGTNTFPASSVPATPTTGATATPDTVVPATVPLPESSLKSQE